MMKKLLTLLGLVLCGIGMAHAQATAGQGAVAGLVTDATKAVVPGAHVVLSNPGIGYKQETTSNNEGYFKFGQLTVVGGYTLEVTAKGFSTGAVKDFATSVGTVVTQNVALAVGDTGTTIEVSGQNVEQVQTDSSSVSQLIDSQIFENSPLSVRDTNVFVGLVAGAAGDGGTGRGFAVNGARSGTGNFQLEGFDNNDQGLGGGGNPIASGAVTSVSPDAIQEYRVITSVPNAEYGRAGGFATDTVMKSGTSTWHGTLFEYNRMQAMAQNNFFSKRNGLQDHLVRNQFGGSTGGKIYKDRTFFYATVEALRMRSGNPATYTSITQDFYNFVKNGNFQKWMEGTAFQNPTLITDPNTGGKIDGLGFCPEYLGTTCPGAFAAVATTGTLFNQLYTKYGKEFPFGTQNQTNIPTDLFLGDTMYTPVNIYGDGQVISSLRQDLNRGSLKVDHRLTDKDQLAFTYAIEQDVNAHNNGGGGPFPGPAYNDYGSAHLFGARWTHNINSNLVNDFRAGYLRHVRNFGTEVDNDRLPSIVAADSLSTGFGAYSGFPQLFTENQFSYEDAATYAHGHHNIKGGFRFVRTRNGSSFYNDVNGSVYYWGAPGMLTDSQNEVIAERLLDGGTTGAYHSTYGILYYGSAAQDPSTQSAPDPYRGYRANEFSAYVQDDYKATPHLVLNYGVRWDYFGPPHNFRGGVDSNVYFGSATSVTSTNPYAPGGSLYLGEQSASFRCVGMNPCGNPANASIGGYALASGTETIWDRDVNNVAPRFGFSYDVLGTGKLVLRGGFGLGYDRLYNNVYENIRFNGPHFVDNTAGYGAGAAGISEALAPKLLTVPFTGNSALSGASPVPRHVNQHLKTAYYEQIHFGVETTLGHGIVAEANYIGTLGRQLVGIMNVNTFEGRVACSGTTTINGVKINNSTLCTNAGLTTAQQSTARPSSAFGNDNFRTNGFSSNYNSGQASIRKGYSHGFQILANYTYSKALDQVSDVFTQKSGGTGIPTPYNPSHNYGVADFDTRHIFSVSGNYESQSQTHKLLLAGWGFSPIFSWSAGTPIYMTSSASTYDPNKDGVTGIERSVYIGPGSPRNSINHNVSAAGDANGTKGTGYFKTGYWNTYTCPANINSGLWCDVPGDRNPITGPRYINIDAQVSKSFKFHDRYGLKLQVAFFNVDGHTQFSNPSGDLNSTHFGVSTSSGQREGQLSGRFSF